jgi:hypothetical protein
MSDPEIVKLKAAGHRHMRAMIEALWNAWDACGEATTSFALASNMRFEKYGYLEYHRELIPSLVTTAMARLIETRSPIDSALRAAIGDDEFEAEVKRRLGL